MHLPNAAHLVEFLAEKRPWAPSTLDKAIAFFKPVSLRGNHDNHPRKIRAPTVFDSNSPKAAAQSF